MAGNFLAANYWNTIPTYCYVKIFVKHGITNNTFVISYLLKLSPCQMIVFVTCLELFNLTTISNKTTLYWAWTMSSETENMEAVLSFFHQRFKIYNYPTLYFMKFVTWIYYFTNTDCFRRIVSTCLFHSN